MQMFSTNQSDTEPLIQTVSDSALIRGIDEDETILEEKLLAGQSWIILQLFSGRDRKLYI